MEGRVAIVTGGAGASGARTPSGSCARARRWWSPTSTTRHSGQDRRPSSASRPGRLRAHDVASAASTEACAQPPRSTRSALDILVNNAALYGDWDMGDQSYEYLQKVFDVNLHGVWLMTRAAAPPMVEQRYGRIINQSSGAAYNYAALPATDVHRPRHVQLQQDQVGRRRAHEVPRPVSSGSTTSP